MVDGVCNMPLRRGMDICRTQLEALAILVLTFHIDAD
jgi:hypothetical protein